MMRWTGDVHSGRLLGVQIVGSLGSGIAKTGRRRRRDPPVSGTVLGGCDISQLWPPGLRQVKRAGLPSVFHMAVTVDTGEVGMPFIGGGNEPIVLLPLAPDCTATKASPLITLRRRYQRRILAGMQKTIVHLTDDLDPSLEATDTIRFAFNNTEYEIDLGDKHINELRSTLDPYVKAARKVGGRRRSAAASRVPSARRPDLSQVRQWAAENGVELSTRGRIAAGVLAAYDATDVKALRAATGTPEPSAKPARRSRAKARTVTARSK